MYELVILFKCGKQESVIVDETTISSIMNGFRTMAGKGCITVLNEHNKYIPTNNYDVFVLNLGEISFIKVKNMIKRIPPPLPVSITGG